MIRSLCILLPLDHHHKPWQSPLSTLAVQLAGRGVAVHVLGPTSTPDEHRRCVDGVVVHELPRPAAAGSPELDDQSWALELARAYQALGRAVHFDAVLATDLGAASLRLETGPGTVLAVLVESARCLADAPDVRGDPGAVLAADAERAALARADLLLSPTDAIVHLLDDGLGRTSRLVPPLLPSPLGPLAGSAAADPPRLLCVGQVGDPGPFALALGLARELAARDERAGLTMALRLADIDDPRVGFLLTDAVTCGDRLDIEVATIDRMPGRDIEALVAGSLALVPLGRNAGIDPFAVSALRNGVPVVVHRDDGIAEVCRDLPGVIPIEQGVASATDRVIAARRRERPAGDGLSHLGPAPAAARIVEVLTAHARGASVAPRFRAPSRDRPRLAVVLTATADAPSTARAIRSLLEHAETPTTIGVVAPPRARAALDAVGADPRLRWINCDDGASAAGRRNLGLEVVHRATEVVAFLHGDVEVTSDWWGPAAAALQEHPERVVASFGFASVVGPSGLRRVRPVKPGERTPLFVTGPLLALGRDALEQVGRFDERLEGGLAADLELALRARRIGLEPTVVDLPSVIHLGHPSCDAAQSPTPNLPGDELAGLLASLDTTAGREFVVLADAGHVLLRPELLRAWSGAFTAQDRAVLVLYGPGTEPDGYVAALEAAARRSGADLERGPRLVAKLPPVVDPALEEQLGRQVHAVLGARPAAAALQRHPLLDGDPERLRLAAARVWQATASVPAPC